MKEIIEEIIIPILQGIIIGSVVYFAFTLIETDEFSLFIGIISGCFVSFIGFNRRIPKKYQPVTFNSNKIKGKAFNQTLESTKPVKVEVWLESPGKYGHYLSSPVKEEILERIGFHLTFLDGKFSHRYLVLNWGILNREELGKLQEELVSIKWAEWKGKDHKGGCILLDKGKLFFRSISRGYRSLTNKEKEIFNYRFTSPSPTDKKLLSEWIKNRDVNIHT